MAGRFKTETDRLTGQFSSDITEIEYIKESSKENKKQIYNSNKYTRTPKDTNAIFLSQVPIAG